MTALCTGWATGLSPEFVAFVKSAREPVHGVPYNMLRPEAVESIFMLWVVTGNPQYREWGWEIFQAFEKYSKVMTLASHQLFCT